MILVVDDEASIRELVRAILSHAGYEVIAAPDADEALRLMEEGLRPVLLLTDIVMPRINGLALAGRVHKEFPTVHILFMTGFASTFEEELSGSVVLKKPFTPAELLTAIADLAGTPEVADSEDQILD